MNVGISFSVGRLTECFRPLHGVLPVNKKSIVGSSLGTQANLPTQWLTGRSMLHACRSRNTFRRIRHFSTDGVQHHPSSEAHFAIALDSHSEGSGTSRLILSSAT